MFTANLSVTDKVTPSPQIVALTGSGTAAVPSDFGLTLTQTTQTVDPGALAQFTITVSTLTGVYSNPVVLSATGLPPGATVTFTPPAVTPGSGSASSVMSIQTLPSSAANRAPRSPRSPAEAPILAALCVPPLLGIRRVRRLSAKLPRMILLFSLVALSLLPFAGLIGCGGGYFGPKPTTFTVTVTGSSGSTQHSTTIMLTVE